MATNITGLGISIGIGLYHKNNTSIISPIVVNDAILLENKNILLLENGSYFKLENNGSNRDKNK